MGTEPTPDVSGIPVQLTAGESLRHVLCDADGASRRVDEPRAMPHPADEFLVEQTLGLLVQRAVLRVQRCAVVG
jgi:hypothetical protein